MKTLNQIRRGIQETVLDPEAHVVPPTKAAGTVTEDSDSDALDKKIEDIKTRMDLYRSRNEFEQDKNRKKENSDELAKLQVDLDKLKLQKRGVQEALSSDPMRRPEWPQRLRQPDLAKYIFAVDNDKSLVVFKAEPGPSKWAINMVTKLGFKYEVETTESQLAEDAEEPQEESVGPISKVAAADLAHKRIPADAKLDIKHAANDNSALIKKMQRPHRIGESDMSKEEPIAEVLKTSDPVEKWIDDFTKSSDEKFKGKSKDERIKMALGAYYGAQKKESIASPSIKESAEGSEHEAEEISITRAELDEMADMADDLFYQLPNFDECPAWVQHKVAGMHAELHSIYDYYRRAIMDRQESSLGAPIDDVEPT